MDLKVNPFYINSNIRTVNKKQNITFSSVTNMEIVFNKTGLQQASFDVLHAINKVIAIALKREEHPQGDAIRAVLKQVIPDYTIPSKKIEDFSNYSPISISSAIGSDKYAILLGEESKLGSVESSKIFSNGQKLLSKGAKELEDYLTSEFMKLHKRILDSSQDNKKIVVNVTKLPDKSIEIDNVEAVL